MKTSIPVVLLTLTFCISVASAQVPTVDDRPAKPGEWGFRPVNGEPTVRTPPAFSWRPQAGAKTYRLEIASDPDFKTVVYAIDGLRYSAHCPSKALPPGDHWWRFRFHDAKGKDSEWSTVRGFIVRSDAVGFPLPAREDLVARVPKAHPRLFVRPEEVESLRKAALGDRKASFEELVKTCEKIRKDPPPVTEPPKYPKGMERGSEEWRKIWWGNRTYTIRVLDSAATLAFVSLLNGHEEYGALAKRLLMAAAEWDPRGSTGFLYNDEAGMPYAYHFSRAYTFLHDRLTEAERKQCRGVMAIRGAEMARQLCPRHFWRPYGSHANRAWHFLGEVGIAFLGEIEEAEEWLWFAMNVFANTYPVWADPDGGWHEGVNYWRSYVGRFTWWADAMKVATGIDAWRLPYFSKAGDYAMYLLPPGTKGGGFGDLNAKITSKSVRELMTTLAGQARNPYWTWYVNAIGGPKVANHYVGWLRGGAEPVEPMSPAELPTSRLFRGNGLAVLNTDLSSAANNVEVIFKSSPMGTQSHGYESQNSFLLYAFGERLFIRTGRRDNYGSRHHRMWMWKTKSVNSITVSGRGQRTCSTEAFGEVTDFFTSKHLDYVEGEAGKAYARDVKSFRRGILFVKPDLVVIHDTLLAETDASFEWYLHSPTPMVREGSVVSVTNGRASAAAYFLAPSGLEFTLTDKFDPPPRPRVRLVEHHLMARTKQRRKDMTFVTVLRPHRSDRPAPPAPALTRIPGGYLLVASTGDGKAIVLLRESGEEPLVGAGLKATGRIATAILDGEGKTRATFAGVGSTVTQVR
ncbi:MAG: DUF4962 domain-containing protein [Planctomycetota bacterium]